ncbi:MAG: hypothetical protein RMM53_09245 [Bacteroidia bacterium]|nr:hypothetical protein [Bacteroidia bacterium]
MKLSPSEKQEMLNKRPGAEKFIRPMLSAHEFINGIERYCLWLTNITPEELKSMPEILERVKKVQEYRQKSPKESTRKNAATPYLFGEIRQPDSTFLLIPRTSSETRLFIPISYFPPNYIVDDSCIALPNATLYHFGVLTSSMHMAWMRAICGRLKSDYRYSAKLVYNNFPWPLEASEERRAAVEEAARGVLEARALYPQSSLADLYDPIATPKELVEAHRKLDAAVDRCYRKERFDGESARLAFLFDLYLKITAPLAAAAGQKRKRGVKK